MTTATLEKPTTTEPRHIRASIDDRALKRVTSFFNGTALDIMTELLQNARRAGATRIKVETSRQGFTVIDDGHGIADPAVLLRFGGSEWDASTIVREDAAGMGVYSLAGMRSRVTSRAGGPETAWTIELGPEDYRGERSVEVARPDFVDLDKLTGPHGTVIDVRWEGAAGLATEYGKDDYTLWTKLRDDPDAGREAATTSATETAARYIPVPVLLNGHTVKQDSYLKGIARGYNWAGLRIGISISKLRVEQKSDTPPTGINVFGHVIKMSLPELEGLESVYKTRVDVVDCPNLKIVLPARKEVVQNDFIEEMKSECERLLLVEMTRNEAKTSFSIFQAARELGLTMAEPPIRLAKWRPDSDDGTTWHTPYENKERVDTKTITQSALIVDSPNKFERANEVLLAWAQENASAMRGPDGTSRARLLLEPDGRLEGYPGYERLWRLVRMDIVCRPETGADEIPVAHHPDLMSETEHQAHMRQHPEDAPAVLPHAKSITVRLETERRAHPDGAVETLNLEYPVPFALLGTNAYAGGILLTEDAENQLDTNELTEILFDAYYEENPSNLDDEMNADEAASYMRNLAMAVMENDDDRRREMLGDGTRDAARSYAPRNRETLVRMRWNPHHGDFDIKVEFLDNATKTGNGSETASRPADI